MTDFIPYGGKFFKGLIFGNFRKYKSDINRIFSSDKWIGQLAFQNYKSKNFIFRKF